MKIQINSCNAEKKQLTQQHYSLLKLKAIHEYYKKFSGPHIFILFYFTDVETA